MSDSVDGYDKYKGLESEHGGSNKSTREGEYDSSISYDKKIEVVKEEICLESSVTKSLSPKLNLNIKYDDDEEAEDAESIEEMLEPIAEPQQDKLEADPIKSLVYVEDSETEDDSSEESVSTSGTNSGSNSGNGTSIEYSISNRSDSGKD